MRIARITAALAVTALSLVAVSSAMAEFKGVGNAITGTGGTQVLSITSGPIVTCEALSVSGKVTSSTAALATFNYSSCTINIAGVKSAVEEVKCSFTFASTTKGVTKAAALPVTVNSSTESPCIIKAPKITCEIKISQTANKNLSGATGTNTGTSEGTIVGNVSGITYTASEHCGVKAGEGKEANYKGEGKEKGTELI